MSINNLALFFKSKLLMKKFKHNKVIIELNTSVHNSTLGKNVYINQNCYLYNCLLDNSTYVNNDTSIVNTKIGKFCSIGAHVKINLGKHPTHFVSTHPAFYSKSKSFKCYSNNNYFQEFDQITIGNDVWIGNNVIIQGGVEIGNGSIIAAGSIVTKNVEPYSIVGGVPAKHIKYRFKPDTINLINESNWWDFENEWFEKNFMLFHNTELFIEAIKTNKQSGICTNK